MFRALNRVGLTGVLVGVALTGSLVGCDTKNIASESEPEEPVCTLDPGAIMSFGSPFVGTFSEMTLQIRNENSADAPENQFHYEIYHEPTVGDCGEFSFPFGGRSGLLGPGQTATISLRFGPHASRVHECRVRLNTVKVRNGNATTDPIQNSCPRDLTWAGFGYPRWEECMGDGDFGPLRAVYSGLGSIVAVGDGGTVLRKGTACSWTKMDLDPIDGSSLDLKGVWGWGDPLLNDHVLWAVGNRPPPPGLGGDRGAIIRYDLSGWTQPSEGVFFTYGSVWGSGPEDVWFVGQGVATDFPNAQRWDGSEMETAMIDWGWSKLTGAHGTSATDVWAVLAEPGRALFHFDGVSWKNETQAFMDQPLYDVWTTEDNQVYAVGAEGAIYHYDSGTWIDETIPYESRDLYGIWFNYRTGVGVAVGEKGVVYHLVGSEWTQHSLSRVSFDVEGLYDVFGVDDGQGIEIWAVGEGEGGSGAILRLAFEF